MRNYQLLLRILFFSVSGVLSLTIQAQSACGVKASFVPGLDSVVSAGELVRFTSTSTNATKLEWYSNGFSRFNNTPELEYGFFTGVHEIMLVASDGVCSDTARVTYFCPGQPANTDSIAASNYGFTGRGNEPKLIDDTREGGFVIGGISTEYAWIPISRPLIIKTKPGGCVEWSRMINDQKGGQIDGLLACADSSVVATGMYYGGGFYMTRFAKDGRPLWQQMYSKADQPLLIKKMAEDEDGSFYGFSNGSSTEGVLKLLKFDAGGNVLWARTYELSSSRDDYTVTRGITVINHQVYITGVASYYRGLGQPSLIKNFLMRVDGKTGELVWMKAYQGNPVDGYFEGVSRYGSSLLVSVSANPYGNRIGQSVWIIDDQGTFLKGINILHQDNYSNSLIGYFTGLNGYAEADTDGNIYLLNYISRSLTLQPYSSTASYFLKLDANFRFLWGRSIGGRGTTQYTMAALNKNREWTGITGALGLLDNAERSSVNYRALKLKEPPDAAAACIANFKDFDFMPVSATSSDMRFLSDVAFQPVRTQLSIPFEAVYPASRFACPDFIDSCAILKVSGPQSVCNLSETYTFRTFRNKKCNLPVKWEVSGAVQILEQNDEFIRVKFSSAGHFSLSAVLLSPCNPQRDSVLVTVVQPNPPSLGDDRVLCSGNTLRLTPGTSYVSYRWQDGSTDSTFIVKETGTYWVQVTDSCGNFLSDTIQVMAAPPIPFDAGPDRTKCNQDTLRLTAPDGFLNYTWSNEDNGSFLQAQTVVVNPLVATAYYVRAEKTPGCFAYDTVRVKVYHSPPIDLGADRSFCLGDSVVFDAGAGFASYLWNNGQTGPSRTATAAGTYSVIATTTEGCKSFDTVKVLQVHALPRPQLDKSALLCQGESRVLSPGAFAAYQWSNGSTGPTISTGTTGTYSVTVTDGNGCKASDTTVIRQLLPVPAGFLPPDTAICSYGSLELKPSADFRQYNWSNGALSKTISITLPGRYWLEATDHNGCKGKDTVVVSPKDCLNGFYIPTAFSPNNDGKNDLFRPLLFGRVKQFRFTVYNRWGQVIYQTTELQKGWDGKLGGIPAEAGVFVWACSYRLEGEGVKNERGTVILIR